MTPPQIQRSQAFNDVYWNLPRTIRRKVDRQLAILKQDITYPGLRVRKMSDMHGIWEGRVDRRYRFTFERTGGVICLRRLGGHDIYAHP